MFRVFNRWIIIFPICRFLHESIIKNRFVLGCISLGSTPELRYPEQDVSGIEDGWMDGCFEVFTVHRQQNTVCLDQVIIPSCLTLTAKPKRFLMAAMKVEGGGRAVW